MSALNRKILALLMALLMGLAPLQALMAASVTASGSECGMESMSAGAGSMGTASMDTASKMMDCSHHDADKNCNSTDCSFGHCASAVSGLISLFEFHALHTGVSDFTVKDDNIVSLLPVSFFRPPRV